jgi:hypothetical protein
MVAGDDSRIVFGKKFPGEKGNVKECIVVMRQPVLLLPQFGTRIFKQSQQNVRLVCGIGC